jgi:hypothetical protein
LRSGPLSCDAAQPLLGSFIDDTVLRAELTPGGSFAAALSRVSREWTWAYARAEMVPLAAWDQLLPGAEPLPYHLQVMRIWTEILNWLRFTYVFENRSAQLCAGAGM